MKRDLCKLMRVDKAYSEVKKKPKSVNVRPGLALGGITLQVGREMGFIYSGMLVVFRLVPRDCKPHFTWRELE